MTARELDCLSHAVITQEMFPGDVFVADLSQIMGRTPIALNKT